MGTRVVTTPLGSYVEAPFRDASRPELSARRPAARRATLPAAPDDLRLEVGVVSGPVALGRRRWLTTWCSVAAHSVGVVATIAVPLLLSSALPEPASAVRVFFADPLLVPPPPPPPPAPAARAAVAPTPPEEVPVQPPVFIAPVEVPSELKLEDGLDFGIEGGVAGGVEGGVPGGVIGAIVGGLPELPEPPPVRPIRISGLLKEPAKIKHVAPAYPPIAAAAQVAGSVVLEALIDEKGHVVDVQLIQGDALFAEAALEAVRQWAYTPTLFDGVPVSVIMTVTVKFQLAR